ncbi:hypothetical protein L1I30_06060 [Gillisia sp. M10.2A]|uniref:Uncharacterized protein n=1 Tax=Gillisia lutea TaxID=2909668 RepID=A0ABS9EIE6_9FLAO|nr:hypothetical protein [Gillisia lutea]MCF4101221.1 hypothetical protein [Gillisia lutea]
MKMKLARTHIPKKIVRARNKRTSEEAILNAVQEILAEDFIKDEIIAATLANGQQDFQNNFNVDLLETGKIFHLSDIEKMCIEYRLRFLDSNYYKAALPYEAISKIKALEKEHDLEIKRFKIMAPAKAFKLKNADDPLLFAPMGNNYHYLIHSWGRDLHPFRKLLMWPFRQLENFIFFLLMISLLLTSLVPEGLFSYKQTTSEFFMILFFMFKWVAGMSIFYGFKKGKNFSADSWQSTYYNA